jgi:hypothetical protein
MIINISKLIYAKNCIKYKNKKPTSNDNYSDAGNYTSSVAKTYYVPLFNTKEIDIKIKPTQEGGQGNEE